MRTKIFSLLVILIFIISCDKPYIDCEYPDYSNCLTQKPEKGKLKVKVTINGENTAVPLVLYYGNVENNVVCINDTLTTSEKEYDLPADIYYSVKVKYMSHNKMINAIDGGKITAKSYLVCDSTCWVVKDVDLNLKLKY